MRHDGFCVNDEGLFVWKIILLYVIGMSYNKLKCDIKKILRDLMLIDM